MHSFHRSGRIRWNSAIRSIHSCECKSTMSMPCSRSQCMPPWALTRLADDHLAEAELIDQAAAVPARGQRRDQDGVVPGRAAPGSAKGVGLPVQRAVAFLHQPVVPHAPAGCRRRERWLRRPGTPPSANPMRACSRATANMPCASRVEPTIGSIFAASLVGDHFFAAAPRIIFLQDKRHAEHGAGGQRQQPECVDVREGRRL